MTGVSATAMRLRGQGAGQLAWERLLDQNPHHLAGLGQGTLDDDPLALPAPPVGPAELVRALDQDLDLAPDPARRLASRDLLLDGEQVVDAPLLLLVGNVVRHPVAGI